MAIDPGTLITGIAGAIGVVTTYILKGRGQKLSWYDQIQEDLEAERAERKSVRAELGAELEAERRKREQTEEKLLAAQHHLAEAREECRQARAELHRALAAMLDQRVGVETGRYPPWPPMPNAMDRGGV